MKAADIMTLEVITVTPDTEVREIARLLLEHRISAVPVVDTDQAVLGIVSEGDLMRLVGNDTDRRQSWLKALFTTNRAEEYVKTHGHKASEIMTPNPITIDENAPLYKIAALFEKHHIKRVPVVKDGRLTGIVSRANLLQGFSVIAQDIDTTVTVDDREIREAILKEINENTGLHFERMNVIVDDGVVQLWGLVTNVDEKKAAQVAAENTPGVKRVENHLGFIPLGSGAF